MTPLRTEAADRAANPLDKRQQQGRSVASRVNAAERRFRECWKLLEAWKRQDSRPHEKELLAFQPTLFAALLNLQELRQELIREKRRLISSKATIPPRRLTHRLRKLDADLGLVEEAVGIGKAIGDTFVWPFYSKDRELLAKHALVQRQRFVPSGVGGRCILETMRKLPGLQGCFLIFHDISSILRLGDFSLFDPHTQRIEVLGEQKAGVPKNGKVEVEMSLLGNPERLQPPPSSPAAAQRHAPNRPAAQEQRRIRQARRMSEALVQARSTKPDMTTSLAFAIHHEALARLLDALATQEFATAPAGNGLSLLGVRLQGHTLHSRMAGSFSGFPPEATELLRAERDRLYLDGSTENALTIAPLHYWNRDAVLLDGMTPLFWWPGRHPRIRDIYFKRVLVHSMYNRAHFLKACRAEGFEVVLDNDRPKELRWKDKAATVRLTGLFHYEWTITQHLFDDANVAKSLAVMRDHCLSLGQDAQVEMRFFQVVGANRLKTQAS